MKYRNVGTSDLKLSEIAFGCGGNAGLIVRGDAREQVRIIARAIELGITYFDNSPDYGAGIAETNLGRALTELKANVIVNTKVEIRGENLHDIAGHVVASAEDSLKRLGRDVIDVFQIHNGPTTKPIKLEGADYKQLSINDYTRADGAMEGVRRLLAAGKIRYAGFICRGNDAPDVELMLKSGLFHLINTPYTLLNPSAAKAQAGMPNLTPNYGGVIDLAQKHGAGAAVYAPLAGGDLSDQSVAGDVRHPLARQQDPESESARRNRRKAQAVQFIARDAGISLAQAAYRFILDHRDVTTALGGFSSMEQLEEISAAADLPPFPADQIAKLSALWRTNFNLG
jgi:L-glyceraldehyde 3-phosphate reductase